MEKARPTGITILAIVYIIFGILSLIWSLLVFGVFGFSATVTSLFGMDAIGSSTAMAGFTGIIAAVIQLIVAFGLWGLKKWAWYLAMIAVGITIVQGVMGFFAGGLAAFVCAGIGLIIPFVIFIYLISARVREVFDI